MIVKPLKAKRSTRPGLFIADPPCVLTEDQVLPLDREVLKGVVVYAKDSDATFALVRGGAGRARYWKRSLVSYEINGVKIRTLRDILRGYDDLQALAVLVAWADWIKGNGANIGTFGGAAMSLFRAGMHRPVKLREPRNCPTDQIMLGGRIERGAERGRYDFTARWDIASAYPSAMRDVRFFHTYREYPGLRGDVFTRSDFGPHGESGYAYATVSIPRLPYGTLPAHENGQLVFPTGELEGIWTLSELEMAHDFGARVTLQRVWLGRVSFEFTSICPQWPALLSQSRGMPPPLSTLAKSTLNALWGCFAVRGRGEWWTFRNGTFDRQIDERDVRPKALSMAGAITSHVRQRVYREALARDDVMILGCHTDGVITELGASFAPNGGGPGKWRQKDAAIVMDYLSPQHYRFFGEDGEWHYVMAGVPDELAPEAFHNLLMVMEDNRTRKGGDWIDDNRYETKRNHNIDFFRALYEAARSGV